MTGKAAALSAAKYAPEACDELHLGRRHWWAWYCFWQHVALVHVCAMLLLLLLLLYCYERAHQFLAKFKLNKKPKGSRCVCVRVCERA